MCMMSTCEHMYGRMSYYCLCILVPWTWIQFMGFSTNLWATHQSSNTNLKDNKHLVKVQLSSIITYCLHFFKEAYMVAKSTSNARHLYYVYIYSWVSHFSICQIVDGLLFLVWNMFNTIFLDIVSCMYPFVSRNFVASHT